MSDAPTRVVAAATGLYAIGLSAVTLLMLVSFATEHDLGIFTQYLWLLGHLHEPFGTIALRPMLVDHFQPTVALLAPLGALGIAPAGLLVLQSLAIAAVAVLLRAVARQRGANGWIAAAPGLLWLVSPVVVKANLYEFHPDAFLPALLIGSLVALDRGRTWLFAILLVLAVGLKEDAGLTVAALGLALAWSGRRRLGTAVAVSGVVWSAVIVLVALPLASDVVRRYYAGLFYGDRADGAGELLVHWVRHPLDTVAGVLTLEKLGILALLIATSAGLCVLAWRWLVVAVPVTAINLLSAYEPQSSLDYHYWLVPAAGVALAGAIGAGRVPAGLRAGWLRGAAVTGALLAVLSAGALSTALGEVRDAWPQRADREAVVRAVPAGASIAVPQHLFAQLADRRRLYALPEPFERLSPATSWGPAERRAATAGLDVVILDRAEPAVSESTLRRLGFRPVLQRGDLVVYRRPA